MSSAAPRTNTQLICKQKGGPLEMVEALMPQLKADQVMVRTRVVALNLLDRKQRDEGILVPQWPFVPGIEGSGVVHAVGSAVDHLKPGDEVMTWVGGTQFTDPIRGSFQEYCVVPSFHAAKKPRNFSLEEAASLPVCYDTAVMAILGCLKVPLPFLPGTTTDGPVPASVLILGGSSATGAAAIQLLRVAYPDLLILVTGSPKHHMHIQSLGASQVFDYRRPSLVADLKAASPGGGGVDMILDCVASGASQTDICDVLDPNGSKMYAEVLTGATVLVPDGVTKIPVSGWDMVNLKGGEQALSALTGLVEDGKYKLPLPVKTIGRGLAHLPDLLDQIDTVSGEKLVVTV